jgi:predicted transcriptional regulator
MVKLKESFLLHKHNTLYSEALSSSALLVYNNKNYIIYYYSTGSYNQLAGFSLLSLEVSRSHTRTHHSR